GDLRADLADPTGFEPAISSVTGWHVGPLHHGSTAGREHSTGSQDGRPGVRTDARLSPQAAAPYAVAAMSSAKVPPRNHADPPRAASVAAATAQATSRLAKMPARTAALAVTQRPSRPTQAAVASCTTPAAAAKIPSANAAPPTARASITNGGRSAWSQAPANNPSPMSSAPLTSAAVPPTERTRRAKPSTGRPVVQRPGRARMSAEAPRIRAVSPSEAVATGSPPGREMTARSPSTA